MNELKTIRKTLNNTTTEFKFDEVGAKFLIKNFSENDCYVGFDPTTIATNSVKISAGKAFLLMTDEYKPEGVRSVYVLGTGEIEVRMVLKYWRSGGKNTVFSGSQYFMNVHKSEGGGSDVVANPVLQGDEDALTGLEVEGVKYRIDNTTYQTFPSGWTTSGTIAQFCAAVNADSAAVEGMAYLGELRCSDLPTGLGNVEAVVEVVDGTGTSGKTIHITITSGNVSPYRWEYTYWNDGTNVSGWKTWLSTEGGDVTGAIELGTTGSITQKGKAIIQANQYNSNVIIGSYDGGRDVYLCAPNGLWRGVNPNTSYRILDTSGGTLTGTLKITDIQNANNHNVIDGNSSNMVTVGHIENNGQVQLVTGENQNVYHKKGNNNSYMMLDTTNGLPLTGGTMSGFIKMPYYTTGIVDSSNHNVIEANQSGGANVGNKYGAVVLKTASSTPINVEYNDSGTYYHVLDTSNTSANPGNTTATLTSLKLNDTNYALAGGTQVTFVDWS